MILAPLPRAATYFSDYHELRVTEERPQSL